MRRPFPALLALALLTLSACDSGERPPDAVELASGLTDLALEATIDTVLVDVAPAFRSAVPLTYAAFVLPAEAATATLEGTRLKLVGKQAGTATVRVTARNESGGSATASFGLTITPQGIVQDDALPVPAALRVRLDSLMVRYSNYFRQTSGLPLTYSLVSVSGPVSALFVEPGYLKVKPTGDGVGRVVVRVSAGGKSILSTLEVTSTTQWCPLVQPGRRLVGLPKNGDQWRFSYVQTDRTSTSTDTLRTESTWTISGGTCSFGFQSFTVDETRNGTLVRTPGSGQRTVTPIQDTRRFSIIFGGSILEIGPYTDRIFFVPMPTGHTGEEQVTVSLNRQLVNGDIYRSTLVASFPGGFESFSVHPLTSGGQSRVLTRVR